MTAFHELADKIWGKTDGKTVTENGYGNGKVFWGMPIDEVLKKINLVPISLQTSLNIVPSSLSIRKWEIWMSILLPTSWIVP